MPPRHTARVMVFDRRLESLAGQRGLDANMRPAEIDFFGGECEPGELPIDAAVRELHEETGIRMKDSSLEHVVTVVDDDGPQRFIRHYFMTRIAELPRIRRLSEPIGAIALPPAALIPTLRFEAHRTAFTMALDRLTVA